MTVNIGIIGCGTIAWYHLKQIQAIESANVTAAYNRSSGPLEKLGTASGLPKSSQYRDYNKLLKQDDLDAVINCLPNSLHSKVTVDALESGLHVLCEKPMATNLAGAKEMTKAAERNNRKLLIGLTCRFKCDSQLMKKVVDSGELGEVYYTKCGWMRRSGIPGWGSWFTREEDAGAGPIYDIGVHTLDLAFWLASNYESAQVLASSYAKFGPERKGLGDWGTHNFDGYYDVEDLATALIKMKNGATVSFDVSWAAHVEKSMFSIQLMGDLGGLDLEKMSIYSSENDRKLEYSETDPYFAEMSHFIDCIQNDEEPVTTPDEMLALQKTLDMILLSCREDRVVTANEV